MRSSLYSTVLVGFLLLAFATKSCSDHSNKSALNSSPFHVLRDSNTAMVLSSLDDSYQQGDRLPFALNAIHMRLIDSLLLTSIDTYNKSQDTGDGVATIDLVRSHYKRQIVPSINSNGEKLVCINCFCSSRENWRTSLVIVEDGGNCYFKLWINLDKSQVMVFLVNSKA